MKNKNLGIAKKAKNDEFYTQYDDIAKEMQAYLELNPNVFANQTILCPCDDPDKSQFTKYFLENFGQLKIKRLISSCIDDGGKVLDTAADNKKVRQLIGDGDFRSDEIRKLRDEADIIITNPPFSLFREFLKWIVEADKDFVVVGNINAIAYKEVFPLIKDNKMWLGNGFHSGNAYFSSPIVRDYADGVVNTKTGLIKFRNVVWFTSLDHGRRKTPLSLMTMEDNVRFSKHKEVKGIGYQKYDNYDAIEVPYTDAIPKDFEGAMGVPISFLSKYNPDQFEILGLAAGNTRGLAGIPSKTGRDGPYINQRLKYSRIFVRHRGTRA